MWGRCDVCHEPEAWVHRPQAWPNSRICTECTDLLFRWLYREGLSTGNPMISELWYKPHYVSVPSTNPHRIMDSKQLLGFKLVPIKSLDT